MKISQTPIICDTNIWYYIANGTLPRQDITGLRLIGTYITGAELCSTPNAYKDFAGFQSVVTAFGKAAAFFTEVPIEYMKYVSGHEWNDAKWREVSEILGTVLRLEELADTEKTKGLIDDYVANNRSDNEPFIDAVESHRSKILYRRSHILHMNTVEARYEHKEDTKRLLTQAAGGVNLDWAALELFLSTFDEWFRQLSIQPTLKLKINDWNDLLNLVYVQPGFLYWTSDERKTKGFIRDCGCGHYLYK